MSCNSLDAPTKFVPQSENIFSGFDLLAMNLVKAFKKSSVD